MLKGVVKSTWDPKDHIDMIPQIPCFLDYLFLWALEPECRILLFTWSLGLLYKSSQKSGALNMDPH